MSDYEKIISAKRPNHYIHGLSKTKFGFIYSNMKVRCTCKKHNRYANYGGRGIKCEWTNFLDFKDDMYESYLEHVALFGERETTIDRINNDGNYCKENCRWATRTEQLNNTSRNRFLVFNGERMTVSDWARKLGIPMKRLHRRITVGMPLERALTNTLL